MHKIFLESKLTKQKEKKDKQSVGCVPPNFSIMSFSSVHKSAPMLQPKLFFAGKQALQ